MTRAHANLSKTKSHLKSVCDEPVLNESKTGEKGDDWYSSTPALFGFMTCCIHTHKYLSIYRLSSVPRCPTLWLVILPIESANQQQQTPIAAAASLWTGWAIGLLHRGALYSIWFDSICIRRRLGRERERRPHQSAQWHNNEPTRADNATRRRQHAHHPPRSIEIGRRRLSFIYAQEWRTEVVLGYLQLAST
jgi:hypothetical protein